MRAVSAFRGMAVVDPDALFLELQSWKAVIAHVDDLIARRGDLMVETTLAGKTMLRKIRAAKAGGYEVMLVFIGTSSAALNVGRIETRTQLGGHAIAVADVRRRWKTTLEHLPDAVEIADRTLLLDNSSVTERFAFVAELEHGVYMGRAGRIPRWAKSALPQLERSRERP